MLYKIVWNSHISSELALFCHFLFLTSGVAKIPIFSEAFQLEVYLPWCLLECFVIFIWEFILLYWLVINPVNLKLSKSLCNLFIYFKSISLCLNCRPEKIVIYCSSILFSFLWVVCWVVFLFVFLFCSVGWFFTARELLWILFVTALPEWHLSFLYFIFSLKCFWKFTHTSFIL